MLCFSNMIKFIPEIIILFSSLIQIVISFTAFRKFSNYLTIIGLIISVFFMTNSLIYPMELYSYLFKVLILISSILILFIKTTRCKLRDCTHFNIIYLLSILFLMMIINSNDYLSLYLNIELFSFSIYFLMTMKKDKISFPETYKYMAISVLASSFILLGSSFLYGLTGSINFFDIAEYLLTHNDSTFSSIIVPYIFILSGLFFKLGGCPFINWVLDIYKNIDTKIVTYISVVPKLAIFSVLIKILNPVESFEFAFLISVFAILTGLYGVTYALRSQNIKELMASSSYINISYMLVALALYTKMSLSTLLFYWVCYVFMNVGAFAGIVALEHSNLTNKELNFSGYFYKNPMFAISFITCIISLLGFPLTSGFVAKIYLISGVLNSGFISIPLLFLLFCLMVLSVVFYLNIVKKSFEDIPYEENIEIKTKSANLYVLYVCTLLTIIIGLFPAWFIKVCEMISFYI